MRAIKRLKALGAEALVFGLNLNLKLDEKKSFDTWSQIFSP